MIDQLSYIVENIVRLELANFFRFVIKFQRKATIVELGLPVVLEHVWICLNTLQHVYDAVFLWIARTRGAINILCKIGFDLIPS